MAKKIAINPIRSVKCLGGEVHHRCKGNDNPLCLKCLRTEPGDPALQWFISPAATESGCNNFIGGSFLDSEQSSRSELE